MTPPGPAVVEQAASFGAEPLHEAPPAGRRPGGVAVPRHTVELVQLVRTACRRGNPLRITSAGPPASHETDCCWVDLSGYNRVEPPNGERLTVVVEPGATFRQVLDKTLPLGLVPKGLGLDLDATVGGTLSGAGVGGMSHRYHSLASQVVYAQVVLGNGDVVHTSPTSERDVYDCVFGGAGRFGVITSVELALEPAPPIVATHSFRYSDCRALLEDMLQLARHPGVQRLVASNAGASPLVWGAQRGIALSLRVVSGGASAQAFVPPSGLKYDAASGPETGSLGQLVGFDDQVGSRSSPGVAGGRATLGAFLPETGALPLLLEHAFECMGPLPSRLVVVAAGDLPSAIAFPATPRAVALVAPIETGSGAAAAPQALHALQQRLYRAGGRLFPTSAGVRSDPEFWRTHYSAKYERIAMLKRWCDPSDIFRSDAGALR